MFWDELEAAERRMIAFRRGTNRLGSELHEYEPRDESISDTYRTANTRVNPDLHAPREPKPDRHRARHGRTA
jgi:hypothetical protein